MANTTTNGINRITAYGDLDYDPVRTPTQNEKNDMKSRLYKFLLNDPVAVLPAHPGPYLDPVDPVSTIQSIFNHAFFNDQNEGILIVDYANFEALARIAYKNLIQKATGDNKISHIPFVIPIAFLFNLIIEANYSQLILIVKRDVRVDDDIKNFIKNGYLNNQTDLPAPNEKGRYYMLETRELMCQRIFDDTLRVNIIHCESSVINQDPHSLKSSDDCTLIAVMHELISQGINNFKFLSGDMAMFNDFITEKNVILPYKIRIESILINAAGKLEIVQTLPNRIIDTTTDPFFTTVFTNGPVVGGNPANRYSDSYTPRRISTGIMPPGPQGQLKTLTILAGVQPIIPFGDQNHLTHLLDLHFFKPGQNRNHRIGNGINQIFLPKGAIAPPGPWYTKYAPIIFMNITEADLLAEPDINSKMAQYYGMPGVNIRSIIHPLPVVGVAIPPSTFYGGYKEKYLKYKAKYLKLKQEMGL